MDVYSAKVWLKGCNYMVPEPNDICNKCGQIHNQDAYEAGLGLFAPSKEQKDEKTSD